MIFHCTFFSAKKVHKKTRRFECFTFWIVLGRVSAVVKHPHATLKVKEGLYICVN